MRSQDPRSRKSVAFFVIGLALLAGGLLAQDPCLQPDNGTGTVTLPPAGCEYLSPQQVHMIIDGLPAGTTIILQPIHERFLCERLGMCGTPGGTLGGEVELFTSNIRLQMSGTGALAGFSRTLNVPLFCETHTGPRRGGGRVQTFRADMFRMQGAITGDPDFDLLRITAGTANGLPSPGRTQLIRQKGDKLFEVRSRFKIHYVIEFRGSPNGKLAGLGGATEGTVVMEAFDLP
jgi:hypothetical protein